MAHYVEACYDADGSMFLPPQRTLGFNPQLKLNDSLLVQSYIEAYDISYPEALRRVEAEVRELRQHLETERRYELNDLGLLHFNEEGSLTFEPCEAGILTPQLYGLGTFQMQPLDSAASSALDSSDAEGSTKPEQLSLQVSDVADEKAITIKMSWLRNMAAAAAAIIAFLMIGTPVSHDRSMLQSALVPSSVEKPLNERPALDEAVTPFDFTLPVAASSVTPNLSTVTSVSSSVPSESLSVTSDSSPVNTESSPATPAPSPVNAAPQTPAYTLVLASQVSQHNADIFVSQLGDGGFSDARVTESKTMRRVIYGSFPSERDAYDALRDLRRQSSHFKQAWVMKLK